MRETWWADHVLLVKRRSSLQNELWSRSGRDESSDRTGWPLLAVRVGE